jgi:hypothetical protein
MEKYKHRQNHVKWNKTFEKTWTESLSGERFDNYLLLLLARDLVCAFFTCNWEGYICVTWRRSQLAPKIWTFKISWLILLTWKVVYLLSTSYRFTTLFEFWDTHLESYPTFSCLVNSKSLNIGEDRWDDNGICVHYAVCCRKNTACPCQILHVLAEIILWSDLQEGANFRFDMKLF